MRNEDSAAFDVVIRDLCLAFNRPHTEDLTRVFWESLKHLHLGEVKRAADAARKNLKKFPTPKDLIPETRVVAPRPKAPEERMSSWGIAANKILFACCFQDTRGLKPVGPYAPVPEGGYGLPLPHKVEPLDLTPQNELLAAKADYVRMAEEAESKGEKWETYDFNRMCREGFQAIIARADAGVAR